MNRSSKSPSLSATDSHTHESCTVPSPCSFCGTGLPMRQRMCSARDIATGSEAPALTSILVHLGSMASRTCISPKYFQHLVAIFMRSSTSSGVKAGWPSWPLCARSLCSCPSLCFMAAAELSGRGSKSLQDASYLKGYGI